MVVKRRAVLAAMTALPFAQSALAALPPADRGVVQDVQKYLNGFKTLKALFSQVAPNGAIATGTLLIERPGRMRLDYDPPSRILIVATDWRVVYYDSSIKQMNVIPVRETPLGFILAEEVDLLSGDAQVTALRRQGGEIAMRVVRVAQPDQGHVELFFAAQPVELRRWTVTDAQGLETTVILEDVTYDVAIDRSAFRAPDPDVFGWPE
jgi:outer membrane lipoprotein-sorting protein